MSESDSNGPITKPSLEQETDSILSRIKALEMANDKKEDDLSYKRRQLQFNKWLTILTGCLVITSLFAIFISIAALDAAKNSADAAAAGVLVAQNSLNLNKASVENTFAEMKTQSKAAQTSAEAAWQQAATNKKALESSIEISRTDQRAWVLAREFKFEKELKAGELNLFHLTIINAGKTPAQHVRIKCTSRLQIKNKPDIVRTELRDEDLALGPGRETVWWFDTEPPRIDQASIDAFESKATVLTLLVEITYQDIFKNNRKTGICAFYRPNKLDFTLCNTGNYVE